jgi:hypothetical protein
MAGISSEGIKLSYKNGSAEYKELTNLQEVPDLGNGERETIEVTCLGDSERKYIPGLFAGSDGLEFKFLYEKEQFNELNALTESANWQIAISDGLTCTFDGSCGVRLDGAGVGAALTYTLTVIPTSKLVFA